MLAGKAGAVRQKRPVDFSTFLKHADAPEPKKQPTSFSSFLRHAMQDSPEIAVFSLFSYWALFCVTSSSPPHICHATDTLPSHSGHGLQALTRWLVTGALRSRRCRMSRRQPTQAHQKSRAPR